jgi:hypothetical protein
VVDPLPEIMRLVARAMLKQKPAKTHSAGFI